MIEKLGQAFVQFKTKCGQIKICQKRDKKTMAGTSQNYADLNFSNIDKQTHIKTQRKRVRERDTFEGVIICDKRLHECCF